MDAIMVTDEMRIIERRTEVAVHIERCRDTAVLNILDIGRWLNVAKDEGLVPHGEWGAWVQAHAGMSERGAQRAMQAAREIPDGSPIARLGIAKIMSLLRLPADEREQAAADMGAAEISSRDVDRRVRALKAERDEALRVVGAQKQQIAQLREQQTNSAAQVARDWSETAKHYEDALKSMDARLQMATREKAELTQTCRDMDAALAAKEDALAAKEREIDQLSDQLDEAQTALARAGVDGGERNSPATRILSAIGALMAEAGQAPSDLGRMQGLLDDQTRQLLIGQARTVGRWAVTVIATCGGDPDVR